jgi:hypothetical protein
MPAPQVHYMPQQSPFQQYQGQYFQYPQPVQQAMVQPPSQHAVPQQPPTQSGQLKKRRKKKSAVAVGAAAGGGGCRSTAHHGAACAGDGAARSGACGFANYDALGGVYPDTGAVAYGCTRACGTCYEAEEGGAMLEMRSQYSCY